MKQLRPVVAAVCLAITTGQVIAEDTVTPIDAMPVTASVCDRLKNDGAVDPFAGQTMMISRLQQCREIVQTLNAILQQEVEMAKRKAELNDVSAPTGTRTSDTKAMTPVAPVIAQPAPPPPVLVQAPKAPEQPQPRVIGVMGQSHATAVLIADATGSMTATVGQMTPLGNVESIANDHVVIDGKFMAVDSGDAPVRHVDRGGVATSPGGARSVGNNPVLRRASGMSAPQPVEVSMEIPEELRKFVRPAP